MRRIALVPSTIIPGYYTPANEDSIIHLQSFGFYDVHTSNHRSLETWKDERVTLGLQEIIRFLIPI